MSSANKTSKQLNLGRLGPGGRQQLNTRGGEETPQAIRQAARRANSGSGGSGGSSTNDGRTITFPVTDDIDPSITRIGRPISILCGGSSPQRVFCRGGTYGCFNGSRVGVCDISNKSCLNPIPDEVVIVTNQTNLQSGQCLLEGDNLVCRFPNYCNKPATSIN